MRIAHSQMTNPIQRSGCQAPGHGSTLGLGTDPTLLLALAQGPPTASSPQQCSSALAASSKHTRPSQVYLRQSSPLLAALIYPPLPSVHQSEAMQRFSKTAPRGPVSGPNDQGQADQELPPTKRQRTALACDRCRSRKIRVSDCHPPKSPVAGLPPLPSVPRLFSHYLEVNTEMSLSIVQWNISFLFPLPR